MKKLIDLLPVSEVFALRVSLALDSRNAPDRTPHPPDGEVAVQPGEQARQLLVDACARYPWFYREVLDCAEECIRSERDRLWSIYSAKCDSSGIAAAQPEYEAWERYIDKTSAALDEIFEEMRYGKQ